MLGFTSAKKPWLPLGPDHETANVEDQLADKSSHLAVYKELVRLRSRTAFKFGHIEFPNTTKSIFSFIRLVFLMRREWSFVLMFLWDCRRAKGETAFLVAVNVSKKGITSDFTRQNSKGYVKWPPTVPENGTVLLRSGKDVSQRSVFLVSCLLSQLCVQY